MSNSGPDFWRERPVPRRIVWLRSGECTPGCGACCEYMLLPIHPAIIANVGFRDWCRWAELHDGIKIEGDWIKLSIKCRELTEDKKCRVYGMPLLRPAMCERFPRQPVDLEGLEDVCTYKFRALGSGA